VVSEISPWKIFDLERMIREMDVLWDIFLETPRKKVKQERNFSFIDVSRPRRRKRRLFEKT
jgi:hypothetical protein